MTPGDVIRLNPAYLDFVYRNEGVPLKYLLGSQPGAEHPGVWIPSGAAAVLVDWDMSGWDLEEGRIGRVGWVTVKFDILYAGRIVTVVGICDDKIPPVFIPMDNTGVVLG